MSIYSFDFINLISSATEQSGNQQGVLSNDFCEILYWVYCGSENSRLDLDWSPKFSLPDMETMILNGATCSRLTLGTKLMSVDAMKH